VIRGERRIDRRQGRDSGLGGKGRSAVIDAFLERRADLVRFFTLRLGSQSEAEDLVQEMYLRLATVEPGADIGNPAGYLYRVGSNLMLQRIRGARRSIARDGAWRAVHHQSVGETDVIDAAAADDAVAAKQRLEAVIRAVGQLPPQTQRVFRLHKLEGLSHAEVAAQLGISRSAVEKHMIAVLKHLAERL
jgi:RNA polymerase sigma-70 factor (ECF subfamily)